ncbi:hypothetical protein V2J09_021793 [Rumex salicifolius]
MEKSEEEELHPVKAFGWAAKDPSGLLSPFFFSRRATREKDVRMKVMYCGICHSDLHAIRNEWGWSFYPLLPGHEVVGVVTEVGPKVTKFKPGDRVGVGCMIDSCRACSNCTRHLENYCPEMVLTYCGRHRVDGTPTYGGYSDHIVVDEHYVVSVPASIPLEAAAPLLCGGIAVYSPLRHFGLDRPGLHIGVVGLGGLGHLAVRFSKAFGVRVTVVSTSPAKRVEAVDQFAADAFLDSNDPDEMKGAMGSMDGVIDTVSARHAVEPLLGLLKTDGKLILVGAPKEPLQLPAFPLISGRRSIAGSGIGGMKETQEMMEFAAAHKIQADVEVIPMDYVNAAMARLANADVRYRFVIDVANTLLQTK